MRVKMCSYCVKGLGKSLGKAAATRDSSYNTSTSLSSISESSDESSSSILSTNIGSIIIDHPEIFPLLNEKKKISLIGGTFKIDHNRVYVTPSTLNNIESPINSGIQMALIETGILFNTASNTPHTVVASIVDGGHSKFMIMSTNVERTRCISFNVLFIGSIEEMQSEFANLRFELSLYCTLPDLSNYIETV